MAVHPLDLDAQRTGFVAADLDAVLQQPPRVLHIGYFLILPNLDAAELAERFARARRAGTVTVLDVATPGPGHYLEPLKVVLPHTDVFVPNTDEAELILGETDPVRQALTFHDLGAHQGRHPRRTGRYRLRAVCASNLAPTPSRSSTAPAAAYIQRRLYRRTVEEPNWGRSPQRLYRRRPVAFAAVGTTAGVFTRPEAEDFIRRLELKVEPIGC